MAGFSLTSPDFKDGDYVPMTHALSADFGFGCAGQNRSPVLQWTDSPVDTKSFVVTVFDPDAPTGSGFWHWLVVNIPPSTSSLDLGIGGMEKPLPGSALQTRTDFGKPGYGGPCPPEGDHAHRYYFTVHAVGAERLAVTAETSAAVIGFQLHFNTIAKASLMALFKR